MKRISFATMASGHHAIAGRNRQAEAKMQLENQIEKPAGWRRFSLDYKNESNSKSNGTPLNVVWRELPAPHNFSRNQSAAKPEWKSVWTPAAAPSNVLDLKPSTDVAGGQGNALSLEI
jgi:hypothetical protein